MFSSQLLRAQTFNPHCKKCSLKHYFDTQHHSNSLPYWFCQIWMFWQDWQGDEPSPEMPEGTKYMGHCGHWSWTYQHNLWLFQETCSPHTGAWVAYLRAGRHCREYICDFLPDLNLIYNWGNSRRVVVFHNTWHRSARKHRACQDGNKTLMIEDRRRKSSVRQEILLWRISRSLPAFYPGRVSLGLLSHRTLDTLKRHNAKPDQETRINTCIFLFALHFHVHISICFVSITCVSTPSPRGTGTNCSCQAFSVHILQMRWFSAWYV